MVLVSRLTESSAGVVEQLSSTQRMAESLVEAQSVALKSQETIIRNGEELKHTLHHSTQGSRRLSPCSVDKVMLMANLLENSPSRKFMSPLHLSQASEQYLMR